MSFNNKIVLVTGAASGIGEAIALFFAEQTAKLSLFDLNLDKLHEVSEKCESLGAAKVFKVNVDVTRDDDLKEGVDSTIREYGRIDVLVNCAGIFKYGGILDTNILDVYDKVLNVNLRAFVATTHYAAEALIASKGCIVNISSILAKAVSTKGIAYSISKAAVTYFTKCVALELADKGVRVNCISPGPVKTNIYKQNKDGEIHFEKFINATPMKHGVERNEIAEMVGFLASDKACSVTGADFVIDSGLVLSTSLKFN